MDMKPLAPIIKHCQLDIAKIKNNKSKQIVQ